MALSASAEGIAVVAVAEATLAELAVVAGVLVQAEGLTVSVSGCVAIVAAVRATDIVAEASLSVAGALAADTEASAAVEATAVGAATESDTALDVLLLLLSGSSDSQSQKSQSGGKGENGLHDFRLGNDLGLVSYLAAIK